MMPPPTHLIGWVKPDSEALDEDNFSGAVQCLCGHEIFEIAHPGATYKDQGEDFPSTIDINGNYFFLVNVKCTACGEEKVIFDADFHGWEGYVCHDLKQSKLPRPDLHAWNCSGCNSVKHKVRINIQTEGQEAFIDEAGKKFPQDRWMDGFSWIDIELTCADCHKETKGWVSYETV